MQKMKIKKGDTVAVITGKDRGTTGKVLRVIPKRSQVLVEGVNVKKRHQRSNKARGQGQIIDKTLPIHVSNVMIVDPKTSKPTRVGMKMDGGKKVRVTTKSGSTLA